MYNQQRARKGLRCQICTGCGLCPGITPQGSSAGKVHILAQDALAGERIPFPETGKRLVAVDVGTTTIAMLLYHKDGSVAERYVTVNPQTVYGADVLSRIQAAEKPENAAALQEKVQDALKKGLEKMKKKIGQDEQLFMVIAANTTMTYLLMHWEPSELGRAPFTASKLCGAAGELEGVPFWVFPGFSAFVGGDILAGCYALDMFHTENRILLIDLGTNGEMVLGNSKRRIACATAAGPAFEGGVNKGIWGADMIHLLALLRREGAVDEEGLLKEPYFARGIRVGNVCVTQEAVRSIQLAKAAIAAGIETLLEKYGITGEAVDSVVLAGGFGYYLNPADAVEIGLLPASLLDKTRAGGNTALAGALAAGRRLLEEPEEKVTEELLQFCQATEVVNLAMEKNFNERYINRMKFEKIK